MEEPTLRDINLCHAHLNALYSALKGKAACIATLYELGLISAETRELSDPEREILMVEEFLEELWEGNPLDFDDDIYSLPEQTQRIVELIHHVQDELETNASITSSLLATSELRTKSQSLGRLVALFACQVEARTTYIEGLVKYGVVFDAPHLEARWRKQLESSHKLRERKTRFIEALQFGELDRGVFSELIDETLLLPASFLCQVHDLNQILSLVDDEFTYQAAEFDTGEARLWHECGIPADRAGYWRAYGIGPHEVFDWLDSGFAEPRDAGTWKIRAFTAHEAELWANAGYNAEQAKMYVSSGYAHPDVAQTLDKWEH